MNTFTVSEFEIVGIHKDVPHDIGFWRTAIGLHEQKTAFPRKDVTSTTGKLRIVTANINPVTRDKINQTKVFYNDREVELTRATSRILDEQHVITFEVSAKNGETYSNWTLYTNKTLEAPTASRLPLRDVKKGTLEKSIKFQEIGITAVKRMIEDRIFGKTFLKGLAFVTPSNPFAAIEDKSVNTHLYLLERNLADPGTGIEVPITRTFFMNRWVKLRTTGATRANKEQPWFLTFEVSIEGEGAHNIWILTSDIKVPER